MFRASDEEPAEKTWGKISWIRTLAVERIGQRLGKVNLEELAQIIEGAIRTKTLSQTFLEIASRLRKNSADANNTTGIIRTVLTPESHQDAQKGCPARPQQAERRGVRFGTLSL